MQAFSFLEVNTQLITGGATNPVKENESSEPIERPIGNKHAKTEAKEGKRNKNLQGSIRSMAESIGDIRRCMMMKTKMRKTIEMHRLGLAKENFWWEKAEKMFGTGCTATEEEKEVLERLMRKRVMRNLEDMERAATSTAGKSGASLEQAAAERVSSAGTRSWSGLEVSTTMGTGSSNDDECVEDA